MIKDYTDCFELERPALIAIAYQMLGERSSAQDLVQDTWEIWNRADKTCIDSPPAWLRTVITRLSIDALKSARRKREVYVGPWLPEPLIEGPEIELCDEFDLARDCELALMWAMERLTVEERSAFILRKAFDSDYSELSRVLGKSEAACRKIVSRASKRVADTRLKFSATPEETSLLLHSFAQACTAMDHDEVLSLLAPDVVSVSDGGGRVRAALRPLIGAHEVAHVLLSVLRKSPLNGAAEIALANGQPAIVVAGGYDESMVLTVGLNDECRIAWIYIMRNPNKLNEIASNSTASLLANSEG